MSRYSIVSMLKSNRFPVPEESGYFFLFIMILMIPRITTAKSSNKDITSSIVISTAPFLKKKEQRRPVSPSPNGFASIRYFLYYDIWDDIVKENIKAGRDSFFIRRETILFEKRMVSRTLPKKNFNSQNRWL